MTILTVKPECAECEVITLYRFCIGEEEYNVMKAYYENNATIEAKSRQYGSKWYETNHPDLNSWDFTSFDYRIK